MSFIMQIIHDYNNTIPFNFKYGGPRYFWEFMRLKLILMKIHEAQNMVRKNLSEHSSHQTISMDLKIFETRMDCSSSLHSECRSCVLSYTHSQLLYVGTNLCKKVEKIVFWPSTNLYMTIADTSKHNYSRQSSKQHMMYARHFNACKIYYKIDLAPSQQWLLFLRSLSLSPSPTIVSTSQIHVQLSHVVLFILTFLIILLPPCSTC